MIKRAGYISLVCIFLFLCTTSNAQKWKTQYINVIPIEDIENPVITCVYKDSYGFVWFGSLNGIYRWDGKKAKHYFHISSKTSSMPANQVISFLFEDEKTNLWFGGLGQGAIKYDRYSDKFSLQVSSGDSSDVEAARWITRAFEDAEGIVWGIGITNNLFKFRLFQDASSSIELIIPDTLNRMNSFNNILTMVHDSQFKNIWLGTSGGVVEYDILNSGFRDFFEEFNEHINSKPVRSLCMQNDSILWIAAPHAVFRYNLKTGTFAEYWKVKGNSIASGIEQIEEIVMQPGNEAELWIFTNTAIYKLHIETSDVIEYVIKNRQHLFESSEFISARNGRFLDDDGFLWLATDNLGAGYANLNKNPFEHILIKGKDGQVITDGATSFYIDQHDDVWVGTGFNGLFHYDQDMNFLEHFEANPKNPLSLTNNFIYSITESGAGILWIGSNKGLNKLDRNQHLIEHYIQTPLPYEGNLPHVRIADLFLDSTEALWVGTSQGVYFSRNPDLTPTIFRQYDSISYYFNLTQQIFSDKFGDLWFVTPTYHGIYRLTSGKESAKRLVNYNLKNKENNFPTDGALCIAADKDDIFWLGTKEGLYRWDRTTDNFKHFYKGNGLGANIVYWLCTDQRGYLWMSTESGLVRIKPDANNIVSKLFTYNDGLPFEKMYPYRFFNGKDNRLYVGGRSGSGDGFYRFYPDSIQENLNIPPIIITDFKVFDKEYKMDSNIVLNKEITLTHENNFFSFEFAALDYTDPLRNQYAFKLEGLDEEWNYSGNRSYANYTDVRPGKYIFKVKGSNNDGYWNEEGSYIYITILPPPWKTWWAYLLYLLAFFGILFSMFYYYFKRQHLLQNLQIEHLRSEKLKELDAMKTRFFANISHELRTPLSLILGPLDKLRRKQKDGQNTSELNLVHRNAKRLQNLINQILTITKLEVGKIKLQVTELNVNDLLKTHILAFESLATHKHIRLTFSSEKEVIKAFIDKEKFEMIMNNLLSNAFKFTDANGEIKVETAKVNQQVKIVVSDTGSGIAPEHITYIFDRFYQVDDPGSSFYHGTGIGLSLTREMVELHHGTISVESEVGKGTVFTLLFPAGKDHFTDDEIVIPKNKSEDVIPAAIHSNEMFSEGDGSKSKPDTDRSTKIILIVEDNADMRFHIAGFFEKDFRVIHAVDGEDGFNKSVQYIPDLIISDVMMPGMNGNQMCAKVKTDERTSHIPVILLTARASKEYRIEGLETGADDFITKPFDGEELQVRVKNLIQQRKRIRALLEEKILKNLAGAAFDFDDSSITSMDEQFLKKVVKTLQENYTNPEFNVDAFSKASGMSRVQLNRKISALTNKTTNDFLRTYRLNIAAELIKRKSATIAEIAYDVGFNSPSYFTECFRKQFGKTPSEFMQ